MIFAIIAGLAAGLTIGFVFDVSYPTEYSFYIAMALLAAIDSLIGAARSYIEEKYNGLIFATGFVCNALLAGLLTFLGTNSAFRCTMPPSLYSVVDSSTIWRL